MKRRSIVASAVTCLGLAAASVVAPSAANAQSAVSAADLEARRGPLPVRSESVRGSGGFAGGQIHYPTSGASGKLGGVVIAPGFTAGEETIRWLGPRIASHGFVVMTIDTITRMDQPPARGQQINAALQYLTQRSSVSQMVDPTRLAASGHSMGGGGAMTAASSNPNIKAIFPLTPWHMTKNWSRLSVPTLMIAAQNDMVAPNGQHSKRFYDTIRGPKAYIEWRGASHMLPNRPDDIMVGHSVAWLKRFLDGDTSVDAYLCSGNQRGNRELSAYEVSCPLPAATGTPGQAPVPAPAPAPAPSFGGGGFGGGGLGSGGFGGGGFGSGGFGGGGFDLGGGSLFSGFGSFSDLFSGMFSGGGGSSFLGGMFG